MYQTAESGFSDGPSAVLLPQNEDSEVPSLQYSASAGLGNPFVFEQTCTDSVME